MHVQLALSCMYPYICRSAKCWGGFREFATGVFGRCDIAAFVQPHLTDLSHLASIEIPFTPT